MLITEYLTQRERRPTALGWFFTVANCAPGIAGIARALVSLLAEHRARHEIVVFFQQIHEISGVMHLLEVLAHVARLHLSICGKPDQRGKRHRKAAQNFEDKGNHAPEK